MANGLVTAATAAVIVFSVLVVVPAAAIIGRTVIILVIAAASLVVTAVIIGSAFPGFAVVAAVPIANKLHAPRQAPGLGPRRTGAPCRSRQWLGSFFALSPPKANLLRCFKRLVTAPLFHLAAATATIGLWRVMEVWHAASITLTRCCIGAVKPPIVSRIAIIRDATRRMPVKDDTLKRSGWRWTHAASRQACRT
jgi:hypothetical protein